jgi:S1-C subfamily serine protease
MSVRTCPYRSAKLHTTVDPTHGFLGITYVFDQKKNVALVTGVASWGPAAEAGLKPNDLVIAVNGDRVDSDLEIQQKISSMRPGTRPTITIEREGSKRDLRPTLMPWPVFTY